jgi:3-hydroxypropanoate dehydrogenase
MHAISEMDIETLFTGAHTHHVWLDKQVDDALLVRAYDLAKMCPTSANGQPMRILFLRSSEAKKRLTPALNTGNITQSETAPVVAIIAMDTEFYEHLPKLYPHANAKSWFAGKSQAIHDTAFRNSSLQGAYFLMALRAVGLDTGAVSGFDNAKVDAEFFTGTTYKSNFIINIGYGDVSKLYPRNPRFEFDEACRII